MSKYSIESAALLCNVAAISYPGYGVCVSCFIVVFVIEKCVYCFTSAVDLMQQLLLYIKGVFNCDLLDLCFLFFLLPLTEYIMDKG